MAWDGYFEYAGVEIINVARTQRYAANEPWFRGCFGDTGVEALPLILGHGTYYSPLQDDPPWSDPDNMDTFDFYGVYPLGVVGVENSSRESNVTENTGDGGIPGRVRHGSKTVVFNTMLIGKHDAAVEAGFQWLKQVLLGGVCSSRAGDACNGADLCYLKAEPIVRTDVYEPIEQHLIQAQYEECLPEYLRSLRRVVFNNGPLVTAKQTTSNGAAVWTVTFTAVAGRPWEFSGDIPLIRGFMRENNPWFGGEEPPGGSFDLDGFISPTEDCAPATYQPIYDPLCPAIVEPPSAPDIPMGCYVEPQNWRRRQIVIPKQFIPLWGETAPVIRVHARVGHVRNLRLRFYADPFDEGDPNTDPCGYCGDILISYVPEHSTLVFDAATQVIYVETAAGTRRRADSLVFNTDGGPFDWPTLTCGFAYVMTLDLPQTQAPPAVDLDLVARTA